MRKLGHDADAVACGSQCVTSGTVRQTLDNRQRLIDGPVRVSAAQIHDGADTAAFMLHFGVVERILSVGHVHSSISADALRICDA